MVKTIHYEVNKLLKEIYNQIFFPKENLTGYFFRYSLVLIFILLLVEFALFLPSLITFEGFLLLGLLFISINSFLGNLRTSVILTSLSFLYIVFFFLDRDLTMQNLFELVIFMTSGILISILINLSKRIDLGTEFGRREHQYQRQIERLTVEKNQVIREIQSHDEFISIASHELKTPLTTTLLKLQTALDNIRNVSLANFSIQNLLDMLESAEQQAQTLGKMITDLLNVSLIRRGRMQLELEQVDLSEITKEIVKRFSEKARKENVEIQLKTHTNLKGYFDKVKIEQVITNLITNALKYGEQKPIFISVGKSGSLGRIAVKDSGVGVPKDVQQKIFNLFERGISIGNHSGLGIGLFVSNQIVKAHRGKILLNSSPGKGSVFTIELPLKKWTA